MENEKIDRKIDRLVQYGMATGLLPDSELIYARNLILDLLHLNEYDGDWSVDEALRAELERGRFGECLEQILAELVSDAIARGIIEDTQTDEEIFETKLMNCLTPRPQEVIRRFEEAYAVSPERATEFFYRFSGDTNYIRRYRLKKDMRWTTETEYGTLEILVSLSKPEKDPKKIAKMLGKASSGYPRCALCCENVGYAGDSRHAARQNHRIIPLTLGGEAFGFQYSPYGYYNEHCIVFNRRHVPMGINQAVFGKLLDFVDLFPHYFIGSNADLPYVGGSILSHEHFQGGRHELPVMSARVRRQIPVNGFGEARCEILEWAVSTIRVSGAQRADVERLSALILDTWKNYEDETVGIRSHTGTERHNTLTPILRKKQGIYEMYLMLRNNRTTPERPYGVFHTRPELFAIKREGIGVIDAPGLAVLPSRLERELAGLKAAVLEGREIREEEPLGKHREWLAAVLEKHPGWTPETLEEILKQEVGVAFGHMLEDAGVFKGDEAGREAFERFAREIEKRVG